jgi:hypothetical protein
MKVCLQHIRIAQIGAPEIGMAQVRFSQVCPSQVRFL